MSTQNSTQELLDEIIVNASELPLEGQEWLLAIAKGMAFTTNCLTKAAKDKEHDEQSA